MQRPLPFASRRSLLAAAALCAAAWLGPAHAPALAQDAVDAPTGKIEGTVKNGVLHLTLPKAGPAQSKKINITSA